MKNPILLPKETVQLFHRSVFHRLSCTAKLFSDPTLELINAFFNPNEIPLPYWPTTRLSCDF